MKHRFSVTGPIAPTGQATSNLLLITVHPGHVSPLVLSQINTVIVLGRDPGSFLREFAQTIDAKPAGGSDARSGARRGAGLVSR